MLSIRTLLCAVLIGGVLFSAPNAEARFGKRSNPSKSSSKSDDTHDASPVGSDNDDDDDDDSGCCRDTPRSHSSSGSFLVDLLFAIFVDSRPSSSYVAPSGGEVATTSSTSSSPLSLRLGVDGGALGGGGTLGAFLGIEGERVGFEGRAVALLLPTDDGTPGTDNINLTNVHLTVALLAREKARFRIEGGFSSAHAPDLTVLGPSLALSLEACLVGALDLEMRAQGTFSPYQQLDGQIGLALHLQSMVLRGGWRGLYLNDAGLVDGVVHEDTFAGPYLGLGLAF